MTEEKAIKIANATGSKPPTGVGNVTPGQEPVQCTIRPNMPICNMGAHGFICSFSDGTCLRHPKPSKED